MFITVTAFDHEVIILFLFFLSISNLKC